MDRRFENDEAVKIPSAESPDLSKVRFVGGLEMTVGG